VVGLKLVELGCGVSEWVGEIRDRTEFIDIGDRSILERVKIRAWELSLNAECTLYVFDIADAW
jgi:hypothetical protein